jgi:preprotein translocase subunit YajC
VSIDDDSNVATIETSPGSTVRVHRQTLARVVEDDVVEEDTVDADAVEHDALEGGASAAGDAPAGETTDDAQRAKKSEL